MKKNTFKWFTTFVLFWSRKNILFKIIIRKNVERIGKDFFTINEINPGSHLFNGHTLLLFQAPQFKSTDKLYFVVCNCKSIFEQINSSPHSNSKKDIFIYCFAFYEKETRTTHNSF